MITTLILAATGVVSLVTGAKHPGVHGVFGLAATAFGALLLFGAFVSLLVFGG